MSREELLQHAKPILFNTDMVRAILDGRKTVTRRIIKHQPKMILCYAFAGCGRGKRMYPDKDAYNYWGDKYKRTSELTPEDRKRMWKPPFHTDDVLYVRETWCKNQNFAEFYYKANRGNGINAPYGLQWKPSIHMPKEAARIFLKVTDVRVERLQCMSWDDICNEGIIPDSDIRDKFSFEMLLNKFKNLWNSTIKKSEIDSYGWDANPWVWVIEFERLEVW